MVAAKECGNDHALELKLNTLWQPSLLAMKVYTTCLNSRSAGIAGKPRSHGYELVLLSPLPLLKAC
ncbi:hypothetical protein AUC60_10345 [Pseudomonas caspiana]|uniref:Uncharacterized protein n=1 Tax=Pseudomonas caspiana TaxID=1451454 RepID=A0A1Y3P574_9PSED|nr:hypothetical protein AUC60_10345 [Pseudomonas caspiana]